MTLIARGVFNGVPIYIGDLLLSSPNPPTNSISIPAATNINALLPTGVTRHVSGVTQKINILSKRLIVAWAGSLIQARAMLRDLKELDESSDSLSDSELIQLIESIPADERDDLSLIGSVCIPDGRGGVHLRHFRYESEIISGSDQKSFVTLAGTGASHFIDILPQIANAVGHPPADIDQGLYEWTEQLGFGLLGQFVGHETLLGSNILQWWGGAVELAGLRDRGFSKIGGDTLFTFWRLIRDSKKGVQYLRLIPKFLKYDYLGEALLVQKIELAIKSNGTANLKAHDLHYCSPLLKTNESQNPLVSVPPLQHKTLCCFILNATSNSAIEEGVRIYHDSDGVDFFRIQMLKNGCQLSFKGQLIQDLETDATNATGVSTSFSQIGD